MALVVVTVAVFAPILTYGFVPWDDPLYVTQNPTVLAGLTWHGVWWALTTGEGFYWHPLTWLTHMLDVSVWGLGGGGHHALNLLLHVMSTLVLFGALRRMTGSAGRSAFVAALFAVHPLHVEPVAWVAERKEVLSAFFFMLTLWTYVSYVRAPGLRRYLLVLLCFVLGLMAKPMIVTLPFVLLLLDVWPLGRIPRGVTTRGRDSDRRRPGPVLARLAGEKLPMFALALASSMVTLANQVSAGSVRSLSGFPLDLRLANALASYVAYIGNMIWPARLAAFYPYPTSVPLWQVVVPAALGLIAATVFVVWALDRRPYLAVGWFWYVGTLLPVIGLVQVGDQARADRFTYVPLIGLFLVVAWGVPDLFRRWRHGRPALAAAGIVVVLACATVARAQARSWRDGFTLWERDVAVTGGNQRAYAGLGHLLEAQGRTADAIAKYREACRFMVNASGLHTRIGTLLMQQGRTGEAIEEFSSALRSQPDNALARYNLGVALESQGKAAEALAQFALGVHTQPESAGAHEAFGSALLRQGKVGEAVGELAAAARIQPGWAEAHNSLAQALAAQGKLDQALHEGLAVVQLAPDNPEWRSNLAGLYDRHGDTREAIQQLETALGLAPRHAGAAVWHYNLAVLFERLGNRSQVVAHLQAALQLDPRDAAARRALARVMVRP